MKCQQKFKHNKIQKYKTIKQIKIKAPKDSIKNAGAFHKTRARAQLVTIHRYSVIISSIVVDHFYNIDDKLKNFQ